MSTATLTLALAVAFGLLALVLNHCFARLAMVELTLNEGHPPGHEPTPVGTTTTTTATLTAQILGPGVHIFLSRTCHACQRLIEQLDQSELTIAAPLHLHYVDRPRPIAQSTAHKLAASLHEHDAPLAVRVEADPLPYAIAVGLQELVSRGTVPTVDRLLTVARDAGLRAEQALRS